MILKSKNAICKELIIIFNQVKIHIKQDLKYFQNNNVEKYQELQLIF